MESPAMDTAMCSTPPALQESKEKEAKAKDEEREKEKIEDKAKAHETLQLLHPRFCQVFLRFMCDIKSKPWGSTRTMMVVQAKWG